MNRIVMSIENNTIGKVLGEFDLDKFAGEVKEETIDKAIYKINEHRIGLSADYRNEDITEENYMYRDDECLWIIEILEELKEQTE